MKNLLKKFKSRGGAFLVSVLFVFLVVGCKDDDNNGQFSGEYFYRINSVTTNTIITAEEQPTRITFFSFNFPYLYATNDKACNDLAQFMTLAGDVTFYGHDIVGKDTTKYEEKKATLTTDGSNLVSFKTKDNTSYEFAFDGAKLTSFALKEAGAATIELADEKIKTIGSNVPDYKQDFKYPTGVKIKLDTVKEGNDEFIKQKGQITFETLKGDNYLVLLTGGDYDSLFCITTKSENSVIRSYRTWGYDELIIASAKDTTFIKEEKVVKGTDGNPLKSVVDPAKDSVIITKKTISLPLLLDNIDDETMKLGGVNFVATRKLKNAKGDADSTITDTIKGEKVTLRSEVYEYYVSARYPREVWKSEIKYLNGLSNGKTVKSISGVSVEEIAYEKKEVYKNANEPDNVGNPSHFKEVSRKTNTVSVTFDSHGVTK